jgi:hypothetical protein
METKFIEVTNMGARNSGNWGKFLVGRFTPKEWARRSHVTESPYYSLLNAVGWTPEHITVIDLQTGEGAIFRAGGYAKADLVKHRVWVCPMFEPFLEWLYKQNLKDLQKLPALINLPDAEFAMSGYRRKGPDA